MIFSAAILVWVSERQIDESGDVGYETGIALLAAPEVAFCSSGGSLDGFAQIVEA